MITIGGVDTRCMLFFFYSPSPPTVYLNVVFPVAVLLSINGSIVLPRMT